MIKKNCKILMHVYYKCVNYLKCLIMTAGRGILTMNGSIFRFYIW